MFSVAYYYKLADEKNKLLMQNAALRTEIEGMKLANNELAIICCQLAINLNRYQDTNKQLVALLQQEQEKTAAKEVKRHKCPHCNYSSNIKDHLKRHLVVHSDERPFKCAHCGQCFKRKDGLNCHVRRIHQEGRNPRHSHQSQLAVAEAEIQSGSEIQN